jgi:hypothetical protein
MAQACGGQVRLTIFPEAGHDAWSDAYARADLYACCSSTGLPGRDRIDKCGMNSSYSSAMKVAVSVPDPVFEAGERVAKRLGVSRSHLYARALKAYVGRYGGQDITEQLNSVYAGQSSDLDAVIESLSLEVLKREPW